MGRVFCAIAFLLFSGCGLVESADESDLVAGKLGDDAQGLLDRHNGWRKCHAAPALVWSEEAAAVASAYAKGYVNCGETGLSHNGNRGQLGENLFAFGGRKGSPNDVVDGWHAEFSNYYDGRAAGFYGNTGHYTQLVWKGTTGLGCAVATCPNNWSIWVCDYSPPGNVTGQFEANVVPWSKAECDK